MNNMINGDFGNKQQLNMNIKPEDLKTLVCEKCEGNLFTEGFMIKTVSPLLTGNGKEGMLPVPAFYCISCKTVVDKYLPEDMRKSKIKL